MLCRECPPTYTRLSEMFGTRRSGHGSLRRCSRRLLAVSVRSVGSPGCLLVVCPLAILRGSRWSSEPLLRSKHLLSTYTRGSAAYNIAMLSSVDRGPCELWQVLSGLPLLGAEWPEPSEPLRYNTAGRGSPVGMLTRFCALTYLSLLGSFPSSAACSSSLLRQFLAGSLMR